MVEAAAGGGGGIIAASRDCICGVWLLVVLLLACWGEDGDDKEECGGEEPVGWQIVVGSGDVGEKRSATWFETTIAQLCSLAKVRRWWPNFINCVERSPNAAPEVAFADRSAR